jgi:hypothetical protein
VRLGKSAAASTATGGNYVNGNSNSSKAERRPPRPGTPSQPRVQADKNGTGPTPAPACTHSYCSNGTGLEPGNGNDSAPAKGQPCAGCVGKGRQQEPQGARRPAPGGPQRRLRVRPPTRASAMATRPTPAALGTTPCAATVKPREADRQATKTRSRSRQDGHLEADQDAPRDQDPTCPVRVDAASGDKKDCDKRTTTKITICHATGSATNRT